jgi:acetyl-CoA acetyltransferase
MTQHETDCDGDFFMVSAARTPIGKFGGALSTVPAMYLGGGGLVLMAFERVQA